MHLSDDAVISGKVSQELICWNKSLVISFVTQRREKTWDQSHLVVACGTVIGEKQKTGSHIVLGCNPTSHCEMGLASYFLLFSKEPNTIKKFSQSYKTCAPTDYVPLTSDTWLHLTPGNANQSQWGIQTSSKLVERRGDFLLAFNIYVLVRLCCCFIRQMISLRLRDHYIDSWRTDFNTYALAGYVFLKSNSINN